MNATHSEYSGPADQPKMAALVRAFPSENLHLVDLPYRFSSWAFDHPANVRLWVDAAGQLIAWAVLQTPFWTLDYALHPQAGGQIHRQILAWADGQAQRIRRTPAGRPAWFVNVFAWQTARLRDLEEAGFTSQADKGPDSWSKVLLQRPPKLPLAGCALPAGFRIRPLAGETEVEAYVELHRLVFESKNMTGEWRQRTLRQPEYLPDLDLVVVKPDGGLAAFCVCWLNRNQDGASSGQVEPLGVHPGYRRLGLGRAILSAGLQRLQTYRPQSIFVETDRERSPAFKLYETVGFHATQDVLVYRKDYE